MPFASEAEQQEVDEQVEDDGAPEKLYCICQTPYDDEKVMIACDR